MKAKAINVSFLPETESIIRRVDRELAMHNFSGTIRYIVHEWAREHGWLPTSPASDGGDGGGSSIIADREDER